MKTIYDLAAANQKQSRIIEAMIPPDAASPLRKLNDLVLASNDLDETEVMLEVYGKRNVAAFSRLKTRFKDILIRTTLLQNINLESAESRVNETYNQLKYALATKILYDLKILNLSIEIAENAIVKAMKYDATESVLLLSRLLVKHFGTSEYNKYKLNVLA